MTNITPYTAEIAWTEAGDATHWSIEYGVGSFTQGNGTLVLTDSNSFTLTGLLANHTYNLYVRSDCDTDNHSEWTTVYTFSTPCYEIDHFPFTENFNTACGPVIPPYLEDFEAVTSFPDCWTQQYNTGVIDWSVVVPTSNPQGAHSGTQAICMKNNAYTSYITTIISPILRLQNINNPTLSFWHTQKIWGNDQDTLAIFYRTTPSGEWTLLVSYNQDIPSWTLDSMLLPNPSNTYQVAFQGTVRYGYGIYLDDISITGEMIPDTCAPAADLTVTDIGNHELTLSWTPDGEADHWTVFYRETGANAWDSVTITVPPVTINELQGVTEYEIFVRTYCEDGVPTSTDTIAVSTTNIGIAGYDNSSTLFPNPTTGLLTVTSSQDLITRVEICDFAGRAVVSSPVEKGNAVRMDVSELPDGVYIVKIYTETSFAVCKLVKK